MHVGPVPFVDWVTSASREHRAETAAGCGLPSPNSAWSRGHRVGPRCVSDKACQAAPCLLVTRTKKRSAPLAGVPRSTQASCAGAGPVRRGSCWSRTGHLGAVSQVALSCPRHPPNSALGIACSFLPLASMWVETRRQIQRNIRPGLGGAAQPQTLRERPGHAAPAGPAHVSASRAGSPSSFRVPLCSVVSPK